MASQTPDALDLSMFHPRGLRLMADAGPSISKGPASIDEQARDMLRVARGLPGFADTQDHVWMVTRESAKLILRRVASPWHPVPPQHPGLISVTLTLDSGDLLRVTHISGTAYTKAPSSSGTLFGPKSTSADVFHETTVTKDPATLSAPSIKVAVTHMVGVLAKIRKTLRSATGGLLRLPALPPAGATGTGNYVERSGSLIFLKPGIEKYGPLFESHGFGLYDGIAALEFSRVLQHIRSRVSQGIHGSPENKTALDIERWANGMHSLADGTLAAARPPAPTAADSTVVSIQGNRPRF